MVEGHVNPKSTATDATLINIEIGQSQKTSQWEAMLYTPLPVLMPHG